MPPTREDLHRIKRLRELFLDEGRGGDPLRDYWRDERDLEAYDRILAARIGWKWDAALGECADRGFRRADDDVVLDFGCGSGVAARRFVARFGAREVLLHDRSAAAMQFAASTLASATNRTSARALRSVHDVSPDVLLVSHVLGELDEHSLDVLRAVIARSQRVVIVEPGNRRTARLLSALRDELVDSFGIVAPCPHRVGCPALATANDWCHFFAVPPPEVFTNGDWVKTAREIEIDLRSLPYAFLALEREAKADAEVVDRILGRPRIGKHDARLMVCSADGLVQTQVTKRALPGFWRELKKSHDKIALSVPRHLPPEAR